MTALRNIARAYVWLFETFGVAAMAIVAIVACLQVFFRYVVGASLYWSEELMRYLTIWCVFGISGLAYSRGELLGFTVLSDGLPRVPRRLLALAVRIIILIFLGFIAWYGFDFAWRTRNDLSIALRISMFWIHLAIPVGCVLMALHVIAHQFLPEPATEAERLSHSTGESAP